MAEQVFAFPGAEESLPAEAFLAAVNYDAAGLVPAIVQDAANGQVLMLAWMNDTSLRRTLELGEAVFWSRSRRELWHKGATSGNSQRVVALRLDCDGDTLLVQVDPAGPACHTGAVSCFFRVLDAADKMTR
jgi:phosphoribosyl-ATP pyrophosphohydrolase/phosphoribosyl-AMP cyclohydrolase